MHWNEGYVSEVAYTYGYYNELNPARVKLAFALAGLVAPKVKAAAELGFGQGMSLLLHGASSDAVWHGNDFNPAQAGFARDMVAEAGLRVDVTDESFAEFCARDDLPDFDYVGLHGIWSWVSQANRDIIVDFLRRKLSVGGVLYVSYNTLPGWGASGPLRHLLFQHNERLGASGQGVVGRVEEAIKFADRVFEADPLYNRRVPAVRERFNLFKEQNRHYLAHEFFNRDWRSFYFSEMVEQLGAAKLDFACSAHFVDAVNPLNLSDAQQGVLEEISDPILKETVRDFMVNQSFRKDYWVKGARRLNDHDHGVAVRSVQLVLITSRGEVPMKVKGATGEADLQPEIYGPLLDVLADYRPHSIGELEQALPQLRLSNIIQAAMVLASLGVLMVAGAVTNETRASAQRINAAICKRAAGTDELGFLASPVTEGGVPTTRFQMLFLLARAEGYRTPQEWARYAWNIVASQNQRLIREGKTLESAEDNIALLEDVATTFARTRLPMLEALEVVPPAA